MTEVLVGILTAALIITFCVRHFFVQLVGLKLFLDVLVLLLCVMRSPGAKDEAAYHAAAWMVSSMGALIFFVLLASGARRFSRASSLDLEGGGD